MADLTSKEIDDTRTVEWQLLSELMVKDGEAIPEVQTILTADDFYLPVSKYVYKAVVDLYKRGSAPALLSIAEELKATGNFDKETSKILGEIAGLTFTNKGARNDALKVKEYSTRRKIKEYATTLRNQSDKLDLPLADLIESAENSLRDICSNNTQKKEQTISDFFISHFESMRNETRRYFQRKTGFNNIDDNQILSPGLYVLGATPACGKTTFAWQLLEQLADSGENCIFCSYEMSAFELFTKSIAREIFKRNNLTEITAAEIRKGAESNLLNEVIADAKNKTTSIKLLEFQDETVDDLLRIIRPYCKDKDNSPVVCVDYLQIIPPSADVKLTTDKARIDDIVHKLKIFQRESNTTFIVVSSFNRVNYYSQVSFESFKDSGNIEYTADVIWAMQLYVANTIKDGAGISATRKKFDSAKMQRPRQIQLKCLKNRQGNNYDCYFNYYSAHDYFTPATLTEFESEYNDAAAASNENKDDDNDQIGEPLSKAESKKASALTGWQ